MQLLKLKFYMDNPKLNQRNKLCSFKVKSDEDAVRIILNFENQGANIRAAFLTPNHQLTNKLSIRFYYKTLPIYKYRKSSY